MSALTRSAAVLLVFTLLSGCAALQDVAKVDKPKASVAGVSVSDLSLQAVTLLVDVEVANVEVVVDVECELAQGFSSVLPLRSFSRQWWLKPLSSSVVIGFPLQSFVRPHGAAELGV